MPYADRDKHNEFQRRIQTRKREERRKAGLTTRGTVPVKPWLLGNTNRRKSDTPVKTNEEMDAAALVWLQERGFR